MSHAKRRQPRKPRGHLPAEHPDNPGCCTCGLPIAAKNARHLDELPPVDPDITAAERRRLGET